MKEMHDDRQNVYEIGYLLVDTLNDEQVAAESEKINKMITNSGAEVIGLEQPHKEALAYSIRRKTLAGSYESYDEAYFGWIKFELATSKIEALKKSIEVLPVVLRMLVITTVKENTYLGKRAPAFAAAKTAALSVPMAEEKKAEEPATMEEMDRTIDEMVKEAI
jgi:ribosomal protein S6